MSAGQKEAEKTPEAVEEGKKKTEDEAKEAMPADTELPKKKPAKSG
ncbi:hypothetical protein JCM39068_29730 [Desulfocastanea catecholica]